MSVKVVVAVGNRKIERCIARMEAIDVLTTVRKREAVLDAVINYNPHAVILSRELSGKTEMTDVIQRCRNLKEQCRIVFIYGEVDAEYKYFSDFLVRQGIYNILTGAVDEDRLEDAIERTYTAEDVVGYPAFPAACGYDGGICHVPHFLCGIPGERRQHNNIQLEGLLHRRYLYDHLCRHHGEV